MAEWELPPLLTKFKGKCTLAGKMNIAARSCADFDVLLFIIEQGRWVNFVSGWCQVQLLQNKMYCRQDGQTIYHCNVTPDLVVKRTDTDFVQITNKAGPDRIVLGMRFSSQADTSSFMVVVEQWTTPGHASMPASRGFNAYQRSEFATVAGGNYQGAPNMRNEPNYYPREQLDQQRGYHAEQRPSTQQQLLVRDGAQVPAPPTRQVGVQEAERANMIQQSKPSITSKQELERYVELLEVALTENDTDFAKSVVTSLIEAKRNYGNFTVKFLPDKQQQTYFKLCVKIEREMFPDEDPVTYFLLVTENFTIQHLQDMIELKFSISSNQQHWIIGKVFAKKKEATLKSFGIGSKGAEVHLFISKGVEASVDDTTPTASDRHQEWHQQQDLYQRSTQQYQGQQRSKPPPEQQYYHQNDQRYHQNDQYYHQHGQYHHQHGQHHHQHVQSHHQQGQLHQQQGQHYDQHDHRYHQQGQQQHQDQYNYNHTNQSYPYQQQQQFNPQSNIPHQSHNTAYNGYGDHRLTQQGSTNYQHYNNHQPFRANDHQPLPYMPGAVMKQPDKPVRPPTPPKIGWPCPRCTVINEPYRPGCEVCGEDRPEDYQPPSGYTPTKDEVRWLQDEVKERLRLEEYTREEKQQQQNEARRNYQALLDVANQNLIPNDEMFECPICFTEIEVGEGVKLRECFHCCCKDCLHDHIMKCHDADVKCPCNVNDEAACKGSITEAEMRSLLTEEELAKVHNRGLVLAEGQAKSYHCKTADCRGFCFYEDEVNNFDCPVCNKRNCLLCKAIHHPEMNCKEYQEDLRIKAANDKAAQETQKMLEDMIKNGEAMYCPNENCRLIIQKKDGCDWIQCSCGTEICWVTKGPRWGPGGRGDTSGGCKCNFFEGRPCHPDCGCCH